MFLKITYKIFQIWLLFLSVSKISLVYSEIYSKLCSGNSSKYSSSILFEFSQDILFELFSFLKFFRKILFSIFFVGCFVNFQTEFLQNVHKDFSWKHCLQCFSNFFTNSFRFLKISCSDYLTNSSSTCLSKIFVRECLRKSCWNSFRKI